MTRYAIGLGCRRSCPAEAIVRLVQDARARSAGLSAIPGEEGKAASPGALLGLFTVELKRNETGLHDAAAALGLTLTFLSPASLEAALGGVLTRSSRVARVTGIPSVAEAAALAGAGQGARLLGPRAARDGATCAVAFVCEERP